MGRHSHQLVYLEGGIDDGGIVSVSKWDGESMANRLVGDWMATMAAAARGESPLCDCQKYHRTDRKTAGGLPIFEPISPPTRST